MYKVAYNDTFGGFCISNEALRLAKSYNIDSNSPWNLILGANPSISSDFGSVYIDEIYVNDETIKIERHDPILIRVIEELGDKVNGEYATIKIANLKGNKYKIFDYSGCETVIDACDFGSFIEIK